MFEQIKTVTYLLDNGETTESLVNAIAHQRHIQKECVITMCEKFGDTLTPAHVFSLLENNQSWIKEIFDDIDKIREFKQNVLGDDTNSKGELI